MERNLYGRSGNAGGGTEKSRGSLLQDQSERRKENVKES